MTGSEDVFAATPQFQARLDAFVDVLTKESDGMPRQRAERLTLVDAARTLLDRLALEVPDEAATARDATDDFASCGRIVANTYTIVERIGQGAVAEIFRVRHRELATEFAFKLLRSDHAQTPLYKTMMREEARILLGLAHPAIVRARDLLRLEDGRLGLIMDLVNGPTLEQRLTHGAIAPAEGRRLAMILAEALAVVHAAGFVHQDISPQNILLAMGEVDRPILVDFGAAWDVTKGAAAARDVSFVGKFSFASPEQFRGAAITSASDIYSLALTLAASVLGAKIPMGHDHASAAQARLAEPDLSLVEKPLREILLKMVAADPKHRPSAEQVVALLRRLAEGERAAKSWIAGLARLSDWRPTERSNRGGA